MKPDAVFYGGLEKSREVAEQVCCWLRGKGYVVSHPEQRTTPSREDRWKYTDDGDLEITLTKRLEVKHWPSIDFQTLADVPYEEIIVDEKYKIDKEHERRLEAYITVNKSRTAAIVISADTRHWWKVKNLYDGAEGEHRDFYLCPKRHCSVIKITKGGND
jgi:hypothetical protein